MSTAIFTCPETQRLCHNPSCTAERCAINGRTPIPATQVARPEAPALLERTAEVLRERGERRDLPGGERSMARCVAIYNAMTGSTMSVAQGWQFMMCLKLSRSMAGKYTADDYLDLVGYAALLAEEKAREQG